MALAVSFQWSKIRSLTPSPVPMHRYLPYLLISFYGWGFLIPLIHWICKIIQQKIKHWLLLISAHLSAGLSVAIIHVSYVYFVWRWLRSPEIIGIGKGHSWWMTMIRQFDYELLIYAMTVGFIYTTQYYRRHREKELATVRLQGQLDRAHLQLLKMQLQPHFLYNALNTISAFTEKDPRTARKIISRLGDLLRVSLETQEDSEIPLQREIKILKTYLEIETLRFQDRLTVIWDVDPETESSLIPAMILQPLVENAVRHGISRSAGPGTLTLRVRREDAILRIEVLDTGPGFPPGAPHREGLGLSNVRKRLETCYPGNHRFEITRPSRGGTSVTLEIPWKQAPGTENREEPAGLQRATVP